MLSDEAHGHRDRSVRSFLRWARTSDRFTASTGRLFADLPAHP